MSPQETHEALTVLGIDLGTTNSAAAIAESSAEGSTVSTLNLDQETQQGTFTNTLVPSFVAITSDREWIGEGAKRLRGSRGAQPCKTIFHDCKNDIGLRKTYHAAPEGFRSAAAIGGRVLRFVREGAVAECGGEFDRIVVTVPASFGANQRAGTLEAARLAGFELSGGDLIDEPVAAFIDFIATRPDLVKAQSDSTQTLLVFDFGGGTCDIAIFNIGADETDRPSISILSASRYHRLGGGDIDAAILHEVLIPQLLDQNGMSTFDVGYREKKREIEPSLIGTAEQLKIKICEEVRKRQGFDSWDEIDLAEVVVRQPGTVTLRVAGKDRQLTSPTLSAEQFERLLTPFLDRDLLYARETEYRLTCSVFAPLQDALDRAGLKPRAIDLCLAVGGSSRIPQVRESLDEYFPNARMLTFPDRESSKTCVARGAARHALALAETGRPILTPVCHEDIGILTEHGAETLVARGCGLPCPPGGRLAVYDGLIAPVSIGEEESFELRVELVAGEDGKRSVFTDIWRVQGPVNRGDPLNLEYGLDANQVMTLELTHSANGQSQSFEAVTENPLTNTVTPHVKREKILAIEEDLKTADCSETEKMQQMIELAQLNADLGETEKAISRLQAVLRRKDAPDAWLLNRLGMLYGEIGDHEKQDKFYREAIDSSPVWDGPSFNLALSQLRRGQTEEAAATLDRVLSRRRNGPYLIMRAQVAEKMMEMPLRERLVEEAGHTFGSLEHMDRWEMGWYEQYARMRSDERLRQEIRSKINEVAHGGDEPSRGEQGGVLPGLQDSQGDDD